jgi:ribosomal protein L37E
MSGLKRRLSRRRATEPEPAAGPPGESVAEPAERSLLDDPAAEQPTEKLPVTELPASEPAASEAAAPAPPPDDLPAGVDPEELAAAPDSSARRGRLRRRIEFLRSARELLLRDLGGFVYELHRTARDSEQEGHRRLRATKLERLDRVEAELHALEQRLDDPRRRVVVREPGVGGECHRCGELFGSDANYCAHCGAPLTDSARKERLKAERPRGEPVGVAEATAVEAGPAAAEAPPAVGATPAEPATAETRADAPAAAADAAPAEPPTAGGDDARRDGPAGADQQPATGRDDARLDGPAGADQQPAAGGHDARLDGPAGADEQPAAGGDDARLNGPAAGNEQPAAADDDRAPRRPGPAEAGRNGASADVVTEVQSGERPA